MRKVYVIIKGWGEYSGRGTYPERVYLNLDRAQAILMRLDAIATKYNNIIRQSPDWDTAYDLREQLEPEIRASYAELGFDAGSEEDWSLAETEIDEHVEGDDV